MINKFRDLQRFGLFDERPENCIYFSASGSTKWIAVIEMPPEDRIITITRATYSQIVNALPSVLHPESIDINSDRHVAYNVKLPRLFYIVHSNYNSGDAYYTLKIVRSQTKFTRPGDFVGRLNYPNIYSGDWKVCMGDMPSLVEDAMYKTPQAKLVCNILIETFWNRDFNTDLSDTAITPMTENPLESFTLSSRLADHPKVFLNIGVRETYRKRKFVELINYVEYDNRFYTSLSNAENIFENDITVKNTDDIFNLDEPLIFSKVELFKDGQLQMCLSAGGLSHKLYFQMYSLESNTTIQISREKYIEYLTCGEYDLMICGLPNMKISGIVNGFSIRQAVISGSRHEYEIVIAVSDKYVLTNCGDSGYDIVYSDIESAKSNPAIVNLISEGLQYRTNQSVLREYIKHDGVIACAHLNSRDAFGFISQYNVNMIQINKCQLLYKQSMYGVRIDKIVYENEDLDIHKNEGLSTFYPNQLKSYVAGVDIPRMVILKNMIIVEYLSQGQIIHTIALPETFNEARNNSCHFESIFDIGNRNRDRWEDGFTPNFIRTFIIDCINTQTFKIALDVATNYGYNIPFRFQGDEVVAERPFIEVDLAVGDKVLITEKNWLRNINDYYRGPCEIVRFYTDDNNMFVELLADDGTIYSFSLIRQGAFTFFNFDYDDITWITKIEDESLFAFVGQKGKIKISDYGFYSTRIYTIIAVVKKRGVNGEEFFNAVFDNGVTIPCEVLDRFFDNSHGTTETRILKSGNLKAYISNPTSHYRKRRGGVDVTSCNRYRIEDANCCFGLINVIVPENFINVVLNNAEPLA